MSSGGGSSSGNGRGNNGISSIPASSRKMIQSLKEVVNCPEHEIYAMLKECNMDPNDAVQRLLSQDPFHEVKSKREKKKEFKETGDSRSRVVSSTSNRGGRSGTERNVGRGSTDSGVLRGKSAYKKENEPNAFLVSASGMTANNFNRQPTYLSDTITAEIKTQTVGGGDGVSSSAQPSSGYQPARMGVPGQVSMADIVKMGRPHSKNSSKPNMSEASYSPYNSGPNTSHHGVKHSFGSGSLPAESHHELHSSLDPASKVSEIVHESGTAASEHVSRDEWPLPEPSPAASRSSMLEPSVASDVYADPSDLHVDRANLHLDSHSDDAQVTRGNDTVENFTLDHVGSASASNLQKHEESSGAASYIDHDSYSFQTHGHAFEHHEGSDDGSNLSNLDYSESSVEDVSVAVSSTSANLQQLSLQKDGLGSPPAADNPAVIIPNHLQVPISDCLHLSFGSFGSGISATYSGSFVSKPLKNHLEEAPVAVSASSVSHPDTRDPDYYGDEQLRSSSNGNAAPRAGVSTVSYDSPSSSQPEVMTQDSAEATHEHQYSFPSSVPGYTLENTTQPNSAFSYAQTNSQMQNLAPFLSVMQAYTNSLPSNLLAASTVQPLRESELAYSPFLATQSMPTKYSNAASSVSDPTISMPEAVKPSVFSQPQPTQQTLPGSSIATGPALPQHLTMHPYSQSALPLGHFANMITYPFMPQSYTYMPSAFQQAYAGNSAYHQSPAAVHSAGIKYTLPQYKNSVSMNNLPQSTSITSGYGGFGNTTNIPGNFPANPSSTPPSTTISYDDVIPSQYKDGSHFAAPLQQNENSAVWVHAPGSRTLSALPASTYYSFQGQNQQHSGYRQGQQPSQHYGALGYPNFYHSQTGVSQEHQLQQQQQQQQQNPSDGSLSGSQGAPSKQSHQIWQHSY